MKKQCVYERYGNYIINRSQSLGAGTFGNVYKGYQIKTVQKVSFLMKGQTYELQPVAIKQSFYQPQNVQQINTLKILKHPNIIRYIDYKIHGNSLFMVMQLCEQGTLQDFLMTIPQDEHQHQTLMFYYCQIVGAMKFMYQKNILHRDIKPSNILMKDNLIKIADFGTSKLKSEMELKTLVGTPLFSSPQLLELSLGQQETYTQKSDIWSLGLVLYLMFNYQRNEQKQSQRLKQSLPWIGKNTGQVFKSIKTIPLKMKRQNIPANIIQIIERMLKINPKERMSFSELFNLKQFQQETYDTLKISLSQSNLAISMSYMPSQADFQLTKTKPNVQKKVDLQNSQSCEVQQIDRQTIDWELFKILQIKDSQSYEDDQIKQALSFYIHLLNQLNQITVNGKGQQQELLFQLQRQIFKLNSWRKWNIQTKRLAHMDVNSNNKSDIRVSNNTMAMVQRQYISEAIQNISQKYLERQDELSTLVDPSKFQKILDNTNSDKVQSKNQVIVQFVQPSEKLLEQIKKFIRRQVTQKLFEPFHKQSIKQKLSISSVPENYNQNKKIVLFIYDLMIALAFEESWKMKNKLQMELTNGAKAHGKQSSNFNNQKFFQKFKKTKNSVKIQQIISRIKSAYTYFKFTPLI